MSKNYQKELDTILSRLAERKDLPSLLIHSCCAPCSSYVLEYLSGYFNIIVYYYNPNIAPESEYLKRFGEQARLIDILNNGNPDKLQSIESDLPLRKIKLISDDYDQNEFYKIAAGLESEPEGGLRCIECFKLRLDRSAGKAAELGCEFFTTTLTVSPHKNADMLNEIGMEAAKKHNVTFLPSDFKKKNGYKRSIELSGQYGLYRQDYCGCVFSMRK